jgi:hypothetical protein
VPKQDRYKVLQERLEGLIKNKLSKLRECPRAPELDLAVPHEIIGELFKAAYKAPTKRHLDVIGSVCDLFFGTAGLVRGRMC